MIVDFHTHIYPPKIASKGVQYIGKFYDFDLDTSFGTKENLDKTCAEAGVDYKVMLSVAIRPDQVSGINNWLSSVVDSHSFGFGTIHPDMDDPFAEIDRFRDLGLTGVKFHPDMQQFAIDDPKMFPIYEKLEGNWPVLFHTGDIRYHYSGAKRLAKVLDAFPGMTVIAAHLGGYTQWDEAEQYLAGRDVYYDTSSAIGFLPKERAVEIIKNHRSDRILFGTDYPVISQKNELKIFHNLGLGKELEEKILWKNAAELLKIEASKD